jgi:ABC-type dipeptide/oligopeptide/nickel transport system ATPase component
MTVVTLSDLIKVRGRFHRSVQLSRDWSDRRYISEYLLTTTAHELALRILQGVQELQGIRAWSITGPYGSGKSAFALFLTELLTQSPSIQPQAQILRTEIGFQLSPFIPVLIVGERSSMMPAFLLSLAESIQSVNVSLAKKIKRSLQGKSKTSSSEVIELVSQAAQAVKQAGYGGLLFIVDEFGKFLEYIALHPENEDLLVIQHLAEAASRSDIPIVLITILHTSFAEYLPRTSEAQRTEWQKVQGRFVDVAFQEPPEQLLKLVGAAIQRQLPSTLETTYLGAVDNILSSHSLCEAHRRFVLADLMAECAPLHPITALLLWPVFRSKLAQNERSLFAFLIGKEPCGFQEFLSLSTWSTEQPQPAFYQVDSLYDYITIALGTAIYIGDRAHRWAEIDHALCRIPADAPVLSQAVVKVVGLVGLYGSAVGLKATKELLSLALNTSEEVIAALSYLEHHSILIYKRHEGAYGLWEGSDVDINACFTEAQRHIGQGNTIARLKEVMTLRPIVARAHYIKTGTLRYFSVGIIEGTEQNLQEILDEDTKSADGRIIHVLAPHLQTRQSLIELAQNLTKNNKGRNELLLFAFPKPIVGLEDALLEVESWRWVLENVQALQGDIVARREVKARLLYAEGGLESIVGRVFGLGGERFDPTVSEWVQGGLVKYPQSAKEFSRWLSELCDMVFYKIPNLQNELINRDRLSSAASKARRNLLEAMLTRDNEVDLGFKGTPAEVSIYRALLSTSGFHRLRDGQLGFGKPHDEWLFVWQQIHQFLEETHISRKPVIGLFSLLKKPPLGFRDGPLPILLCIILLTYRDQIALYEEGTFVQELRIEVLERLLRMPELFEIQEYVLTDYYKEALATISTTLQSLRLSKDQQPASELLQVVKPLVTFAAHLPAYTKNTKKLDPLQAKEVRDVLLKAQDPYNLLFSDLPTTLGITLTSQEDALRLKQLLEPCLLGLQQAYPHLLDEIEMQLRDTFSLHGTSEETKDQLRVRASLLNGHIAERSLALFVREASRLEHSDWREALARVIRGGHPPHQWHDADLLNFQIQLRQIARDFTRLEELVLESRRTGATQILQIGLLNGHLQEDRAVIAMYPEQISAIDSLTQRVFDLLEEEKGENEALRQVRLAAIAKVAARYLKHQEGTEENE